MLQSSRFEATSLQRTRRAYSHDSHSNDTRVRPPAIVFPSPIYEFPDSKYPLNLSLSCIPASNTTS